MAKTKVTSTKKVLRPKPQGASPRASKIPTRILTVFVISMILIAGMLWTILSNMAGTSSARRNPKLCNQDNTGKGAKSSLCVMGSKNTCSDGCICDAFRPGFKFGRCIINDSLPTPAPTDLPQEPTPTPSVVDTTPPPKMPSNECPLDMRLCPDGTAVSREAPTCDFGPCPGEETSLFNKLWGSLSGN